MIAQLQGNSIKIWNINQRIELNYTMINWKMFILFIIIFFVYFSLHIKNACAWLTKRIRIFKDCILLCLLFSYHWKWLTALTQLIQLMLSSGLSWWRSFSNWILFMFEIKKNKLCFLNWNCNWFTFHASHTYFR